MAVPAGAYVCAYCKKRLRTSRTTWTVLIVIVAVIVIGYMGKPTPPPPAPPAAAPAVKVEPPASKAPVGKKKGAKSYPENSLEGLINDPKLGKMFVGAEQSGALCYLKMDPGIWNAWGHDGQQQAMDMLAKAPVWKANGISRVVLKVYATEVGILHSGWDGEWKFDRE
jgi:hypothetical protein